MTIQSVLRIITLLIGLSAMLGGVYHDIKERRYPKPFFFISVIAGLLYAWCSGFFTQALIAFIAFTLMGIWASDKHIIANGDLWCISTLFLYISITNIHEGIMLIVMLLIWATIIGAYHHRNILEDFKNGFTKFKAMIGYKIYFTVDTENVKKSETIPMTVILVGALISTLIVCEVIGW